MSEVFTIELRSGSISGPILATTSVTLNEPTPSLFALSSPNPRIYTPSSAKFVLYGPTINKILVETLGPGGTPTQFGEQFYCSNPLALPDNSGFIVARYGYTTTNNDDVGTEFGIINLARYTNNGELVWNRLLENSLYPGMFSGTHLRFDSTGKVLFFHYSNNSSGQASFHLHVVNTDNTGYQQYQYVQSPVDTSPPNLFQRASVVESSLGDDGKIYGISYRHYHVFNTDYTLFQTPSRYDYVWRGPTFSRRLAFYNIFTDSGANPASWIIGSLTDGSFSGLLVARINNDGSVISARRLYSTTNVYAFSSAIKEGNSIVIGVDAGNGANGIMRIDLTSLSVTSYSQIAYYAPFSNSYNPLSPVEIGANLSYYITKGSDGSYYLAQDSYDNVCYTYSVDIVKLDSNFQVLGSMGHSTSIKEFLSYGYPYGGFTCNSTHLLLTLDSAYGSKFEGSLLGANADSCLFFCPISELLSETSKGWYGTGTGTRYFQQRHIDSGTYFNSPFSVSWSVEDVTARLTRTQPTTNIVSGEYVTSARSFGTGVFTKVVAPTPTLARNYSGSSVVNYSQSSVFIDAEPADFASMNNSSIDETTKTLTDSVNYREYVQLSLTEPHNIYSVTLGSDFNGTLLDGFWGTFYTANCPLQFTPDNSNWYYFGATKSYNINLGGTEVKSSTNLQASAIRISSNSPYTNVAITEFSIT